MFDNLSANDKNNVICILLDRSGSMQSNWTETKSALDEYINSLKDTNSHFLIASFDDQNSFEILSNSKSPSLPNISPRGMTPLYDAIGQLDKEIKKEIKNIKRCEIVIFTDGQENCSCKFKKSDISEIMKSWENLEYNYQYIGADFDAMSEGMIFGASMNKTINIKKGKEKEMFAFASEATRSYLSSGSQTSYSPEVRASVA